MVASPFGEPPGRRLVGLRGGFIARWRAKPNHPDMNTPSHEAVAQRASELWQSHDRPTGRDNEFWLEAERQLSGAAADSSAAAVAAEVAKIAGVSVRPAGLAEPVGPAAAADFPVATAAPTNAVPMPGGAGAKVVQQKQMARAPKLPSKTAPKALPPESGKPLWDKPHSS